MKNIKKAVIKFILLFVVLFISCSDINEVVNQKIELAILDVFLNLPQIDSVGNKIGLEEL